MSAAAALRTFVESQPRYSTFVPLLGHLPLLHGDVVACVFLNSASSKTATANAEALPRMMQVHYAVAHADDADAKATTLAGWRLEKRTPAGRWGRIEELVGAAVFLASEASSFVNGHTLFVDGGITASL